MSKKQNKDKQLLENLDRIVAGEKLPDESGLDKDTKAALELSREMTKWPKSPSKEFKADLKAKVIHNLAEETKQKAAKNDGSETRDIFRRPAWQLTFAALIVVVILAVVLVIVWLVNR
jgi:cell division septal protein FtsQ